MGVFIRQSSSPSDKYGSITYYVDGNGFVRQSSATHNKAGAILYYVDANGFVRKSTSPHDKAGDIVYYVDASGFVRRSTAPHDKAGDVVYYVDANSFVRRSSAPHDKSGQIVFYLEKEKKEEENPIDEKKGVMLAIAFVIGLIFAPVLIVLGMFGKFLLGGLFKNVLPIEDFKKFRKIYSIINFVWLGLGITAVVLLTIFASEAVEIALYSLVGGNILLFILSVVLGNKIYNEHKHELPQDSNETVEISKSIVASGDDEPNEDTSVPTEPMQGEIAGTASAPFDAMTKELTSYKAMLDMGLISQSEYNSLKDNLFQKMGLSKSNSPIAALVSLWICNILNFLGIFINMMIALGTNGYLHSMYKYIFGGYIAGFSVITICTPAIIAISLAIKGKVKTNPAVKNAIIGGIISIALTAFLMILSAFL